jgi:hypothetical protein
MGFLVVPTERIELPTNGLQNRCSTAELRRQQPASLAANIPTINERARPSGAEIDVKVLGLYQPAVRCPTAEPNRRGVHVLNGESCTINRRFCCCLEAWS